MTVRNISWATDFLLLSLRIYAVSCLGLGHSNVRACCELPFCMHSESRDNAQISRTGSIDLKILCAG